MTEKESNYIPGQDINWDKAIKGLGSLSEREMEVATLSSGGLSAKEIATKLGISESTVKAHRQAVYNRLGLDNTTKLSLVWQKLVDHNGEFRIP